MTKGGRRDHWCLQTSWAHRKGQNKMGNKIASRTFSRQRISCCPRAGKPEEDQTAFGETLPVLLSKTLHPMAFICTPTAPSYFSPVSPRPSLGSGHQIVSKVPRKTGGGFATVPTASEQKGQSTYVTARARGAPELPPRRQVRLRLPPHAARARPRSPIFTFPGPLPRHTHRSGSFLPVGGAPSKVWRRGQRRAPHAEGRDGAGRWDRTDREGPPPPPPPSLPPAERPAGGAPRTAPGCGSASPGCGVGDAGLAGGCPSQRAGI